MTKSRVDRKLERLNRQLEIYKKDTLTDADLLEINLLDIDDYSVYYRIGMKRALRHAIKLLKKEERRK